MGPPVTNGISFGRKTVSNVRFGDGHRVGDGHSGALTEVASRVASALARALRLASEVGAHQSLNGSVTDPYQIDDIAAQLADQLGGSKADSGSLARALHDFARESAALIGARPHSQSFSAIERAIAKATSENGEAQTVSTAIIAIERTTNYVKSGV
jgi:chorismate mutase